MKKIILILFALSLSFSSCEKDDICDANTPTTPKVVIEFFQIANPTLPNGVTNLAIVETGNPVVYRVFNGDIKIKIPLKSLEDITRYDFILNNNVSGFTNIDKLQFNYTRKQIFVSRACGYKTIFSLDVNSPTLTDSSLLDGFWIRNIVVSKPNINDENETHVKIYF